jgi:hypothetical protein
LAGQTQRPALQVKLGGQTVPHWPQFCGLVLGSVQRVPHSTVPCGQTQRPAWQTVPPAQALPHAPQL